MPLVRDRLEELQTLQIDNETQAKKGGRKSGDVKIDLEECAVVRQWIDSIKDKTVKAEEILKNPKLHSSKDLQDELKKLFKNSETVLFKVTDKLKLMRVDKNLLEDDASAAVKMRYLQYTSLQEHFQETLAQHRDCIERHRRHLKMLALKTHRAVHGDAEIGDEELEILIDDQGQTFTDNCLADIREAQLQLRDIEQRHDELLIIERHLSEVRDMFVQIAILVEQQQENINRAEHHALLSTNAIEAATIDLGKAEKKKKKVSKIKIIIIVGLIILLLIVLLSIIFR